MKHFIIDRAVQRLFKEYDHAGWDADSPNVPERHREAYERWLFIHSIGRSRPRGIVKLNSSTSRQAISQAVAAARPSNPVASHAVKLFASGTPAADAVSSWFNEPRIKP